MADKEMSFLEHLEDLRWHLLRSITAILIAALAAFLAKDFVFDLLDQNNFLYYHFVKRPIWFDDGFCISELPFRSKVVRWLGSFQHTFGPR